MEKPVNEVIIYQGKPLISPEDGGTPEEYGIIATEGYCKPDVITLQDYFLREDGSKDINGEIDLSRDMITKLYIEYCFEKAVK